MSNPPGRFWQRLARWLARLTGWQLVDKRPPGKKYLIFGAPHPTNWDLYTALLVLLGLGIRPCWVGKALLFRGPLGPLMRWLGGIPMRRDVRQNFVEQIVQWYRQSEELVLVIAPEGTRSRTEYWNTSPSAPTSPSPWASSITRPVPAASAATSPPAATWKPT